MTNFSRARHTFHPAWGIAVFLLLAVVGLFYVKWSPYYDRAFVAAQMHSIGQSMLTAGADTVPAPSLRAALDYAWAYGRSIWQALLLGLLLGSAMQALLPAHLVRKWLGAASNRSVLAATLLSVPSMMCTCCSAPVVTGLRRCKAASGSTVAYWLGNTMLNPATLVFMGFVLGWKWVGLRLVLGLVLVLGLGWLLNRMNRVSGPASTGMPHSSDSAAQMAQQPDDAEPRLDLAQALQCWARAFVGMALRLLPEYLVLVLLLGATRAWLFPALGVGVDDSLLWIVGAAVAGMLFVIPTAGEVPIVQAMLSLGMASGPAAALLLTLPPVSLPSLAMVAKSFQARELFVVIAGVVMMGVLAGGAAIALGY
ncbi:MAG TPA: permease [Burkholderiaceae bacterium]|nr:permease [Burkholderiaceae bacterium]